jgi:hypothetical protein
MSYAERRKGALTGVWIAERVIKGETKRFRAATKALGDAWEKHVDLHGVAPLDGTGASIKHAIGAVAKEARANREGWKGSHDTSLTSALKWCCPSSALLAAGEHHEGEALCVRDGLEARKGRDGGPLNAKTINRYLAVVSAILDYARGCDYTKHVVDIPWQEEGEGRIEFLQARGRARYRLEAL